ncbi:transmembrane protein 223-like [Macrosteles quadrilineatus]|uniref:transmembrane protein 223-like n=1 Tax=Macrosteles quadrilineatus TaxID=74068 RepID=UPI0023E33248|nr:transmembrane protein 223-like [Macrosteles quadrilineatus]XP_054287096.1 transmembrane protein 223-like [Macrosteles quadrilineatus]XP_054287097.1 transmembrane protein 223-like [Macrosteles quadrilineatus]
MLYLSVSKLIPMYGHIVKNCKSKLCIVSQNLKIRSVLTRPNSNLPKQAESKTEPPNIKTNNQEKDKILFYYENPRYYTIINAFAFVQFFFWLHLSEFSLNKGEKLKMESNEFSPWWKKIDLEDKKTRKIVASSCFLIGYLILSVSWIYTLRSVRMLVLRKDNKTVSIVTYGPFARNRVLEVPLENITTNVSREFAKTQLPIKVKGKWFYYILDVKEGKFQNPVLFDHTAGMKRTFK